MEERLEQVLARERAFVLSVRATLLDLGSGEGCDSPCARDARLSLTAALTFWENGDRVFDLLGGSHA